jgi:mono/diheme cytochrome c family protein
MAAGFGAARHLRIAIATSAGSEATEIVEHNRISAVWRTPMPVLTRLKFKRRSGVGRASNFALLVSGTIGVALFSVTTAARQTSSGPVPAPPTSPAVRAVLDTYCITCHNERLRTAGLALDGVDLSNPGANAELWEKVIGKLRAGSMPPAGRPRPDAATYRSVASALERDIDRAWAASPNPGRIAAVHRLNRAEYNHAIRDLFALDLDVKPLLPGDETADASFDNFADSLSISTTHLERYLSVARQVTRIAVGLPPASPTLETFEIPLHVMQDDRQHEDLPLGSRGGIAIRHDFPVRGEYLVKVRLQRQYQDYLKGMGWPQQLDVRLDGKLLKRFSVGGKAQGRPAAGSYAGDGEPGFAGDDSWEKYMQIGGDAGLQIRFPVDPGPHIVGVSFVRELFEPEGLPQPLQRGRVITNDQVYMEHANVGSVQIGGPYGTAVPAKDTPSRRAIFVCQPRRVAEEQACSAKILSRMARLAYRRPATERDVETLRGFFDAGRHDGGSFDAGIQFALERLLVDPDFLLRVSRDPTVPGPWGRGRGRGAVFCL